MTVDIDRLDRRCPRLGGPVALRYCLENGSDNLPCFKVIDCWWEMFDVVSFVRERLPQDQFDQLMSSREKPPEKISSLIDLIEKAKQRHSTSDS